MADDCKSAGAEIQPFNSRVQRPVPELSSERHLECGELVNGRSVFCSSRQQMAEREAKSSTCSGDEVMDKRIFMTKEIFPSEECVAKLSLENAEGDAHEGDENNDLSRIQTKSEECGMEILESMIQNDAMRPLLDRQVVRNEEFGNGAQLSTMAVNNSSIPEQQMAKHDESNVDLSDHKQGFNSEEEGSMIQKISKHDECIAHSQHATVVVDENIKPFYPQIGEVEDGSEKSPWTVGLLSDQQLFSDVHPQEEKYFCYDPPLYGETGSWIPVSVPPMSESEHEEWNRSFGLSGGYLPGGDMDWSQMMGEDKELSMWDVVLEMVLVARGKVNALTSGDLGTISWISSHLMEQAWREMSETLTEANFGNTREILEAEPPKWLPDSAASACMLCSLRFHPIMCTRHHCRFCGGLFCGECTKGRSLLPEKFRIADPQRVCDVCCVRLESVQPYLMDHVSRAAQLPTHDLTDLSTLRSWLNFPWGQSMEYEIYKATNTVRSYSKVGILARERKIPEAILRDAKGLAILTVVKVGMMVTYNIGTGLVVARREDGSWSPPSAISSFGVGWGAQAGGELTDFIIVLRTNDAVKTFISDSHLSIGAGLSAAFGVIGRTAEADVRAGPSGYAACYTYSCSKGAFVGCSLEGSIVATRRRENSRFYGSQSLTAYDILLGSLPRPPAAAILYRALGDLYQKL